MNTADFDYHLPPSFIAQRPAEPRDSARLMVMRRESGSFQDSVFRDLPTFLNAGDVMVINRTRVIPARLKARKLPGGGRAEILLLKRLSPGQWECLVGGKGLRPGRKVDIVGGPGGEIVEDFGGPRRVIRFDYPIGRELDSIGEMPLPPYIKTPLQDPDEYQTVFAREPGSSAAPTAGLHFTPGLLRGIQAAGIQLVEVTLHVGLDTFAPVDEANPEEHSIHSEWCRLDDAAATALNDARARGARVVAVGTTSARTLETAVQNPGGRFSAIEGPTDLYILPGYDFRAVDALITNFHLPRSTLLMMVSAFAGREAILDAYERAKRLEYRFYSFGDAMLIL